MPATVPPAGDIPIEPLVASGLYTAGRWQTHRMRPVRRTRYARAHDLDSWKDR